jgi:hypothetical protein
MIFLSLFDPELLHRILSVAVGDISLELPMDSIDFSWVLVSSFNLLAEAVISFITVVVALFGVAWALRRLLTWYRFPHAEKWLMRVGLGVIGWMALVLALIVLPISTAPFRKPFNLFSLSSLAGLAGGSVIFAFGLYAFTWADRHYGGRCPACDHLLKGHYELGRSCPKCQQRMHPWLITEYER